MKQNNPDTSTRKLQFIYMYTQEAQDPWCPVSITYIIHVVFVHKNNLYIIMIMVSTTYLCAK